MSSSYALMTRLRVPVMSVVLAVTCLQPSAAGPGPIAVLRVGQPVENPTYRLGTSTVVEEFVENQGPDSSVNGELSVYISQPVDVVGGMTSDPSKHPGTPGGAFCPKDPGYATSAHCHFDQLRPGQRMYVLVHVQLAPWYTSDPNWDNQGAGVQFKAFSQTPEFAGTFRSEIHEANVGIIFCRSTQSRPAGCKTAK
jgi:hypothetical protein